MLVLLTRARRGWKPQTFLVAASYAATLILFVAANKLTTSAATIFLQATAPLYLALMGPFLLREPIGKRDWGMMGVLALGLVMMFLGTDPPQRSAPNPFLGNIFAALAGACYGVTIAGLRWLGRHAPPDESPALGAVTCGNLLAFLACLPFALPVISFRLPDLGAILLLGIFQIALAYLLLTRGITRVAALEAGLLLLLEPVLNPVWTFLLQGEKPGLTTLLGGALILGATLLLSRPN